MLIGLTGHAGAGKDSTALVLAAAGWRSIALADALRVEVAAAWRVDIRLLTDRTHKEHPITALRAGNADNADWLRYAAVNGFSLLQERSPRWVMQQWGSFRRQTDPLHWVRPVVYWVQFQREHGVDDLVVTDVRQRNEAEALHNLGGHILRVHKPGAVPPLAADTAGHETEAHIRLAVADDIYNDGTLPDLANETWRVVRRLSSPWVAQRCGAAPW